MILLRQKLYTRQDKKVIHELWSATKGFRELPKNYKGMTTRDLYRINKLTRDFDKTWNKGKMNAIDWKDVETIAKHMKLPETAKGSKHLIEKYSNQELLERYKSIKAHKLGLGKEYKTVKEWKKLKDDIKKMEKKIDKRALTPAEEKKYENLMKKRYGPGSMDNVSAEVKLKQIDREEGKADKSPLTMLIDALKSKKGSPKLTISGKQRKLQQAAGEKFRESKTSNKEMYNRLKKEARKHNKKVTMNDTKNCARLGTNEIFLSKESDSTLAHELGHHQIYRRMGGRKSAKTYVGKNGGRYKVSPIPFLPPTNTSPENPLYHLSEELRASSQALATMKKLGASKNTLRRSRKQLENAYKTYYHNELAEVPNRINKKLRFID